MPTPQQIAAKAIQKAQRALKKGVLLKVKYDFFTRLVEVHTVGVTKAGNSCMRVFQVGGGSVQGEKQGWKMLLMDGVLDAKLTKTPSLAPRPGYKMGDKGMTSITMELISEPETKPEPEENNDSIEKVG